MWWLQRDNELHFLSQFVAAILVALIFIINMINNIWKNEKNKKNMYNYNTNQ